MRIVERRLRIDRRSPFAGMVNPFTGVRAPQDPEDKRVLYAELFYPFAGGQPDRLTFTPPMNAEGVPTVSIGIIVFHREVPVIDFRFFSGATFRAMTDSRSSSLQQCQPPGNTSAGFQIPATAEIVCQIVRYALLAG